MSSYSKGLLADNFNASYKQLGEKDKTTFSSLCFRLLNENYIYGQCERDLYYQIDRFKEIMQDYFGIIDYELVNDSAYKIFFLKSAGERTSVKLKKFESMILLILRRFYYVKTCETGSDADIAVTYDELLGEIRKNGIYKEDIKKTELLNSLKILKRYKIINFDYRSFSTSDALTVYPTILYAVSQIDLENITSILAGYGAKEDDSENETVEDTTD